MKIKTLMFSLLSLFGVFGLVSCKGNAGDITTDATATTTTTTTSSQIVGQNGVNWEALWYKIADWCLHVGIKVIIAIIVMFISFKLINFIFKRISKRLEKRKADPTLSRVLCNVARIGLKVLILAGLVGYVGIETASVTAVVASAGVGISLAVQGTLSNFAGGVIIIIMRPFKLGDFITSNGQSGTVEDIKLFYTHICTPDNRMIYIPNGTLANNVIVNNSVKDTRRLDVTFDVDYSTNVELAKNLIRKVASESDLILKDPETFVEVTEYADSSIKITIRAWVKKENYWPTNWYLLKEVKNAFDENGITIPFNQIDVNIKK